MVINSKKLLAHLLESRFPTFATYSILKWSERADSGADPWAVAAADGRACHCTASDSWPASAALPACQPGGSRPPRQSAERESQAQA